MFDRVRSFSLAYDVEQTVRVAGAVRDRLSADNWRLVTQLSQAFEPPAPSAGLAEALELVDRTILALVAVGGLEVQHMTRDDGWRFLGIGRSIERLLSMVTVVAEVAASGDAEHPALLEWLLDLADSAITYRARYVRQPEWLAVADLLLFDRRNPRSAAYQLGQLAKHVGLLPGADLGELIAAIGRAGEAGGAGAPMQEDLFSAPGPLAPFLDRCEALAVRLSDALTRRYFSHVYEPAHATGVL
jgi:uncharacterized alpha-E superfamily protein